jgi:hypothetical protein
MRTRDGWPRPPVGPWRERRSIGSIVAELVATGLALPVAFILWALTALATDPCGSDQHGGICSATVENLAAGFGYYGVPVSAALGIVLVSLLPTRNGQRLAACCCILAAVGCLTISLTLISQPVR